MDRAILVACRLYEYLDTPRSLSCFIMAKHEMWDDLSTLKIDPSAYLDTISGVERFRRDHQAVNFLRKYDDLAVSTDRKQKAVTTFYSAEQQCFETNRFLELLHYPSASETACETAARRILQRARKIVRRILGPIPDSLELGFGPGTTAELKGSAYTTLADKMWVQPHGTPSCLAVFEAFYWPTAWGQTRMELKLPLPAAIRGNRFTTVPKDSQTDRGICIEPLANLACQLAVGRYMKRKLGGVGIRVQRNRKRKPHEFTVDQVTGQQVHRQLAKSASMNGEFCTVDLSNASDTVSRELIRWLMPDDWFALLSALRSPCTLIDAGSGPKWHHLEKFSSMGNGFTFELETLVFASLISALTGRRIGEEVWVYGDDLIFPSAHYRDVVALLSFCGFTPNQKKSFNAGFFRESCGGDYADGFDVRPVQLKNTSSPLAWYDIHNQLRRKFPFARHVLSACVGSVPRRMRVFGPSFIQGGLFHSLTYKSRMKHGIRWGVAFQATPHRIPLDRWGDEFTLCLALLGVKSSGLTPRGLVSGFKPHQISFS